MHDLHHKIQAQWSMSVSAACAMIWIIYNFHFLNNAEIIQPCWRAELLDLSSLKRHFLPLLNCLISFLVCFSALKGNFLCSENAHLNTCKHPGLPNRSGSAVVRALPSGCYYCVSLILSLLSGALQRSRALVWNGSRGCCTLLQNKVLNWRCRSRSQTH